MSEFKYKRKRKSSYLKNAKKYGKKGRFGRGSQLDEDTYQYFIKIMEVYNAGFDSEGDKLIFVENVFEQTNRKEILCSCNQFGCRVIETLLPFANDSVLKRYMTQFRAELRPLCSDEFASHVLESLVKEASKRSSKISNDSKNDFTEFVVTISKFLLNNLEDFVWNTYANHIIRTCLGILAGLREEKRVKSSEDEDIKIEIREEYAEIVKEYGERLLKWPQFDTLALGEKTSGMLQVLLKVLKVIDKKLFKEYCTKLLNDVFAKDFDVNNENNDILPCFNSIPTLMLMETFLELCKKKRFTQIYVKCFDGKLVKLAKMRATNFAVQKLLTHCKEQQEFEGMFNELADHYEDILKEGHSGVILALGQGCKKFLTKQGTFTQNLIKALDCYESEEKQNALILCLARLKKYEENKLLSNDNIQQEKLNLHGTLLIQILLDFNKPLKIINSLLNLSDDVLKNLFSNTMGSHIVDSYMNSKFVGEKSRDKLYKKLKGSYQDLAQTKFGSRSFEAIWNAVSLKQKVEIIEELSHKDGLWANSEFGRIIANKINLALYKRSKDQ